jgi:hypothetical protein
MATLESLRAQVGDHETMKPRYQSLENAAQLRETFFEETTALLHSAMAQADSETLGLTNSARKKVLRALEAVQEWLTTWRIEMQAFQESFARACEPARKSRALTLRRD